MTTPPDATGSAVTQPVDDPAPQYLAPDRVLHAMAAFGRGRLEQLTLPRALVLAMLGGGFITAGALFSVLLASGVEADGLRHLLMGFGFSAGFFFVVLSEAVLFTEANVVMPATLLERPRAAGRVLAFWATAWVGNLAGAMVFGALIAVAQLYPPAVLEALAATVDGKMAYRDLGGPGAWGQLILSGVLANWLVGMAAFFAFMGRTIIGKYIPVLLAVTLFVTAGFQHSPANMGYFSLLIAHGEGPGWLSALGWNIIPAGLGNIVGAVLLVAVPYWLVFRETSSVAYQGS